MRLVGGVQQDVAGGDVAVDEVRGAAVVQEGQGAGDAERDAVPDRPAELVREARRGVGIFPRVF